jgi:hypothetical protein
MRATLLIAGAVAALTAVAAAPAGAQDSPQVPDELRDVRYCEIIPSVTEGDTVTTYVYNTLGWNDCPAAQWDALTVEQVNQAYGSQDAKLNGPRYWVVDHLVGSGETAAGGTFTFGGIKMSLRAKLTTKVGEATVGEQFYVPNRVQRNTTYTFDRDKLMYELVDPDGNVYVMQSYAQIVAKNLTLAKLSALGPLLRLPDGWHYRTRRPDHDVQVTADGLAIVINDNLANSYQRIRPPATTIAGAPSGCASGSVKLRIAVTGDTAVTRVRVNGRTVKRTTAAEVTVTAPADARVVAVSRNDAGVSRARASLRACD